MNYLIPLLSGFVGAIIGAIGSVATVYLQTRADRRKELMKLAVEAAIKERDVQIEQAQRSPLNVPVDVPPLSAYVYFHWKFFEMLQEGGLTEESLRELYAQQEKLLARISTFVK